MARAVLERELIPRKSRVRFELATEADDASIRQILRENPMPGRIALSLEREPDYFAESKIPGTVRQTILAREGNRVVCVGSCVVRSLFVNGSPQQVGYLGGLRLEATVAGRFDILRRGYQFFRELQAETCPDFLFTSIAADNFRALDFLERGLPGMPVYEYLGDFVTVVLPVIGFRKSGARNSDASQRPCQSHNDPQALACFINHHNRQFQLAPCWSAEEICALEELGLRNHDFVVRNGGERLSACAALWDQRSFKQTVIRGYAPRLARARRLVNFFAKLLQKPQLPAIGTALSHAIVSHLTVQDTNPGELTELIDELRRVAGVRDLDFLMLGLAANDSRLAIVRARFKRREYRSRIYSVRWPENRGGLKLDRGPLQPELALL